MIHTVDNFYNKVVTELKSNYFPNENHGLTYNKKYFKTLQAVEDFNNGCLTYRKLIGRVAKNCNETTENIHKLIEPSIISFGSYEYKPKKH